MGIYNRTGKVIEFNDGSTIDLKALLSNTHNYQLMILPLKDIQLFEEYQNINDENKGPSTKISESSLQQSLRIYGMAHPLTVGRIMTGDGTEKFILLDGYKRYYYLNADNIKAANCLIIDLPSEIIDSVIRFLINQNTIPTVDQKLKAYQDISDSTQSIKKNFIEPALGLKMNDLDLLDQAKNSADIQVERVFQRYIEGTADIETIRRVLERSENGETKPIFSQALSAETRQADAAQINNAQTDNTGRQTNTAALDTNKGVEKMSDRERTAQNALGQTNAKSTEFNQTPSSSNAYHEEKDNGYKDGAMGFGVDKDGAAAIEGIGGNKTSIHPDLPDETQEEKHLKSLAAEKEKSQANENKTEANHQSVNDRQILPRELRLKVLERDGNRCQVCGIGGKKSPSIASTFELHHMIDVQYGGDDTADNLLTLCPLCHRLITTYGVQKRGILHGLKPYNPTDIELDNNPQFWTIPILGAIEKAAYREALAQLKSNKRTLYARVIKHTLTIGQALSEYQSKYNGQIKFDFKAYPILQYGKLRLLQTKDDFDLLNEELADKYESYGDSIIEDNHDKLHKIIDNLVGYNKIEN